MLQEEFCSNAYYLIYTLEMIKKRKEKKKSVVKFIVLMLLLVTVYNLSNYTRELLQRALHEPSIWLKCSQSKENCKYPNKKHVQVVGRVIVDKPRPLGAKPCPISVTSSTAPGAFSLD